MKLTLKKPIKLGEEGEPISVLTFREEVVAGDMRGIPMREPPHYDDLMKIAGRLCGQPDPVMNKIGFEDMKEVLEIVGGFLSGGPETGTAT
jgi:hypothetical protein